MHILVMIGVGVHLGLELALPVAATSGLKTMPSWVRQAPPFDTVAALMGLDSPSPEGQDLDVRITEWSPLRTAPTPFLRIVETNGNVRAQLFVWWDPRYLSPLGSPTGDDVRCTEPTLPLKTCAKPLPLRTSHDWRELARQVIAAPMCERGKAVVTDTRDLSVRIFDRGESWHYGCSDPLSRATEGPGTKQAAAVMTLLGELLAEASP